MKHMNVCKICRVESVEMLVRTAKLPISNRFVVESTQEEYAHPMELGQCRACGLVQIRHAVPAEELRPRFDWINYREQDRHLDQLADTLSHLPGVTQDSKICGIHKFNDGALLERMKDRGFQKVRWLDAEKDLKITQAGAGVETVQDRLNPEIAKAISRVHGRSDVIIARHSLEHAHDVFKFTEALRELVNPHGYVVIEVPDGRRCMERCDYSALWEEHVLYFTSETFCNSFSFLGLSLFDFKVYPYQLEDNLVGIGRVEDQPKTSFPSREVLEKETQRARGYGQGFEKTQKAARKFLEEYRQTQGDIALLGAGHRACAFINFLGLGECIKFVVDDDPHKQGLRMPGSHLPIYSSSSLIKEKVKLCLLGIDPENEDKVIQKNRKFLELGGSFFSISPDSPRCLPFFDRQSNEQHVFTA